MRQVSLATKIGTTAELRPGSPDVIIASEPTLGATLRTKGRFYFLCEVARQQGNAGGDVAKEVADLARQEYYYDLSAGIEVSLFVGPRTELYEGMVVGENSRDVARVTLWPACWRPTASGRHANGASTTVEIPKRTARNANSG